MARQRTRKVAYNNAHTVIRLTATQCTLSTEARHKKTGLTEHSVLDLPPAPERRQGFETKRAWKRARAEIAKVICSIHGINEAPVHD